MSGRSWLRKHIERNVCECCPAQNPDEVAPPCLVPILPFILLCLIGGPYAVLDIGQRIFRRQPAWAVRQNDESHNLAATYKARPYPQRFTRDFHLRDRRLSRLESLPNQIYDPSTQINAKGLTVFKRLHPDIPATPITEHDGRNVCIGQLLVAIQYMEIRKRHRSVYQPCRYGHANRDDPSARVTSYILQR